MMFEFYLPVFFLAAYFLTDKLRAYAIKKSIMDIPNERSSHRVSTPRGGGVAIVICFSLGVILSAFAGFIDYIIASLIFSGGALVAVIGWQDDRGHVSARWRLLAHFIGASMVVFCIGLPPLEVLYWKFDLGIAGDLLAVVALVWILNLFNFMDGIDGIAGSQAVISSLVIGLLLVFEFNQQGLANLHWIMTVSALGFLLLNFPPAKIFMGDAGSGFLGLMLGALLLLSAQVDQSLLWAWLIMLAVFIVDATFTLLRRLCRAEAIYQAHSSHAYQAAARKYGSHLRVTTAVILINILWLAPIAYLVTIEQFLIPGCWV